MDYHNNIQRQRDYRSVRRELERQLSSPGRREQRATRSPYSDNTLEPCEEVIERRRRRKNVRMQDRAVRSMLGENIFLLTMLVAAAYGLYRLCIYTLN